MTGKITATSVISSAVQAVSTALAGAVITVRAGAPEELAVGATAGEGTSPEEAVLQWERRLGVNCCTQQGRKIEQNKVPMLTVHSLP